MFQAHAFLTAWFGVGRGSTPHEAIVNLQEKYNKHVGVDCLQFSYRPVDGMIFLNSSYLPCGMITPARPVQNACGRCTVGVMDQNNPHLQGICQCECHQS